MKKRKKEKKENDLMEIRMMLDDKYYHLCEEVKYDENNKIINRWILFEKHDYWLTDGSEPIMTSETHTYEDLYKFVKKNRTINLDKVLGISTMIIVSLVLGLCILNMSLHNATLRGFILGVDFFAIVSSIIRFAVSEKNFQFKMRNLAERWEKLMRG